MSEVLPERMLEMLPGAYFETLPDLVRNGLVVRLKTYMQGCRIAEFDVYFTEPKNWFQHLKKQVGLKHKTREKVAHVVRYRTYPNSNVVLPKQQFGDPYLWEQVRWKER